MSKSKWLFSLVCFSGSLLAQPQDPTHVAGWMFINPPSADTLEILTTDKTIIDWKSFSIEAGETTRFVQQNASDAVLNRVAGNIPSNILGTLESNGAVYLINPQGILIGSEGKINVAQFAASTLDLDNNQFLQTGDLNFVSSTESSSIVNLGIIDVGCGKAYLLSTRICNSGKIRGSEVTLATGSSILLQLAGDGNLYIRPGSAGMPIENTGVIEAIQVELASGSTIQSLGIQNSGTLDALNVSTKNGRIVLRAENSSVESSGRLAAKTSVAISASTAHLTPSNEISAPQVNIETAGLLNHEGSITAQNATLVVTSESSLVHVGSIHAAGVITLIAPRFLNAGLLETERGGKISIDIAGSAIETAFARVAAPKGQIIHHAGTYFSSGTYSAPSGSIEIFADRMNLFDAHLDADSVIVGKHLAAQKEASYLYLSRSTMATIFSKPRSERNFSMKSPVPRSTCARSSGRRSSSTAETVRSSILKTRRPGTSELCHTS